jgi:peptidoglycan/xylan/chitin deacetylase (PgdA/CDA1 family)
LTGPGPTVAARAGRAVLAATALAVGCTGSEGARSAHGAHGPQEPRPTVFRPPFGNCNRDTLRAAKSCGIGYAPIWDEEVHVDHWEYHERDRSLHPGDIVLTHFRGRADWNGTMPDVIRRFLQKVTDDGYAVARLEDYL